MMNTKTLISAHASLHGTITTKQSIIIQGHMEGLLSSDECVTIDQEGSCHGEIVAKEIVIKGSFDGKVTCDLLTISNRGHFKGHIESYLLVVEAKGSFEGTRHITEKKWASPKKERKPIAHLDTENILL